MSGGWLARILATKALEIEQLSALALPSAPPRRPLTLARTEGSPLRLIAEIKRRSPSAGVLSTHLGVAERAAAYERAGAAMISVLCDRTYFDGDLAHLRAAREVTSIPLLCKDFIIHERQLLAARAFGADAALLIARCLAPERLQDLVAAARELELEPFVEVTTEAEVETAIAAEAPIIGVNARDLDTLTVDPARARRILSQLPPSVVRVHLSGIRAADDVAQIARSGVDAALVGEVLMRADEPGPLLRELGLAAGASLAAMPSAD